MSRRASAQDAPKPIEVRAAALILDAFLDYNARFSDITRRAQRRFERRDWKHARRDTVARIDLYHGCINETLGRLELLLDERVRSRPLWSQIRREFETLVAPLLDSELTKTFFNTLSRRFFNTSGVAPDIEFVALDIEPTASIVAPVARHHYEVGDDLAAVCEKVLGDFPFANGYADAPRCAQAIAACLRERALYADIAPIVAIELLKTVFFRERRAYLVGRISGKHAAAPMVMALITTPDGVRADAILTEVDHVSLLFGYTRSYFHADLPTIGDTVVFLQGLLPHRPIDELYTVLGRAKQGKTERYRHLFRHLAAHPDEQLVEADGERGMVMAVFTPKAYPLVFKVIRDRFAYPKDIARREVEERYRMVFHYDRIGRLVDAQEFRDLRFPLAQVDPELLQHLVAECAETIVVENNGDEGGYMLVKHCYVERRLRPMNLYVREVPIEAATSAVLDYGQAIKDLARSNIFPGDLLLKNFGISRRGRAIFYDYDELCLVENCRFRELPEPSEDQEMRPLDEWVMVRDGDVFPEQFSRFLGLPAVLRQALIDTHGEIFSAQWWRDLQARWASGGRDDVVPYPAATRLLD